MKTIFLGMALLCAALLGLALWTAYDDVRLTAALSPTSLHMLAGLTAALVLLMLHGFMILNYFIATGKAVDQAMEGHAEFAAYKKRTRKLKGRTFPFATMAAIFTIVAAVLGGAAWRAGGSPWHRGFAWFAVAFNIFAFYMEYTSIKRNMALLDEVRAKWGARQEERKKQRLAAASASRESDKPAGDHAPVAR